MGTYFYMPQISSLLFLKNVPDWQRWQWWHHRGYDASLKQLLHWTVLHIVNCLKCTWYTEVLGSWLHSHYHYRVLPLLRQFNTSFLPWRPSFNPRWLDMQFVMDKVAMGHSFLRVPLFLHFWPGDHHCSILIYHCPLICPIALTRQHITNSSLKLRGFISDLALGWLQSKESKLLNCHYSYMYWFSISETGIGNYPFKINIITNKSFRIMKTNII
jgi:hypothetical protein